MEARIVQLPTNDVHVDGDRIVIERLVVRDAGLAGHLAERPGGGSTDFRRAGAEDRPARAPGRRRDGQRRRHPDGVREAAARSRSRSTSARRRPSTRHCAPTSLTATDACRGRSSASSATRAPFAPTWVSCSTRRSATARSGGCGRSSGRTSTATPRSSPSCSIPPARTRPCTSSGSRSRKDSNDLNERLAAIEAAAAARGAERARSTAKGADFEDLLEAMLGDLARGSGDLLDRTGSEAGGTSSVRRRATSS